MPPPSAGAGALLRVDLGAVVANWRSLCDLVGSACAVAAVVKADGYGLGMLPVARALARAGCRWFFVALPEEGVRLAESLEGSEVRIAVLSGPIPGSEADFAGRPALIPVLNDLGQVARWRRLASGRSAILHLDTGMGRLGLPESEAARLAADPALIGDMPVALVMSHLACADEPANRRNLAQLGSFARRAVPLPPAPRSIAASSGIFLGPGFHLDLVRAGAALYGLNPTPGAPNPMRQVVALQARILQIREIDRGGSVGYGATWTAEGPRRIATLALGYADGILRSAGNAAHLQFGATEVPVIGRISMDLVTVDVTCVPPPLPPPGEFVEVVGARYGIDALARDSGTIGYEVLTRLGPRLHRVYC